MAITHQDYNTLYTHIIVAAQNIMAPLPNTQFNPPGSANSISEEYTHLTVLSGSRITAKLIAEFQLNI